MPRHGSTFSLVALTSTGVLLLSAPAHAFGSRCEVASLNETGGESSENDHALSLREKASRFAPRLQFRAWFEPSDDFNDRQRAQQSALTPAPEPAPAPEPIRHNATVHEPFGWQVSFSWSLVEMAEAVHPSLAESPIRLVSTECFESQSMARALLVEEDLGEENLNDEQSLVDFTFDRIGEVR